MGALIFFIFAMAVVMVVLACLDQRMLWWKMVAWRYRDPEAQEPSEGALSFSRGGYVFGAMMMVVCGIIMINADASTTYDQGQVRSSVESAAEKLKGTGDDHSYSFGPTSSDVHQAIEDEAGNALEVTDSGTDSYEVTNRKGDHPVCLVVKNDSDLDLGDDDDDPWSSEVTTDVTDGRC